MTEERKESIRLLVVDDSATVRSIIRAMMAGERGIEVAGEARDGFEAVEMAERLRPDVILMDINMPRMDGLAATERIMAGRAVPIVAFSTLTWGGEAKASIDMLAAGALDVMGKPDLSDPEAVESCARALGRKIRIASRVAVVRHLRTRMPAELPKSDLPSAPLSGVAIGASTGGPAALRELLRALPSSFPLPVLVVQHITRGFTDGFVEWLQQQTELAVRTAAAEDRALPGVVLVAPEGRHMELRPDGSVRCVSTRPRGVHLPSADVLFSSAASAWKERGVGVLLTGMGSDGAEGLLEMKRAGAATVAQDEESCVIYGMPAEAVRLGAASLLLPPREIGEFLRRAGEREKGAREGSRG